MERMKQFHVRSRKELFRDLWIGLVIGILCIPLSMGYAQVAGLPPQYGLYGSMLPILVFGLLTSSPRFVFGVDAAPAALVAALLPELGVAAGSAGAVPVMSAITLLVAFWLFLFFLLRGGRFAKFVSEPVLAGCVSGIASIVILTQMPRLFGGTAASGRAPVLIAHLFGQLEYFHPLSFLLGFVTVAVIFAGRRQTKVSLSVVLMIVGILLTMIFHLDRYGVAMVAPVSPGLPPLIPISFAPLTHHAEAIIIDTLAVALVIAAETLVSTQDFARRYGDTVDNQRELLAYAAGNLAAAVFGSSPVIGGLSRTNRANKLGVTSQWMSVSAFAVLGLFLLFGTPMLSYLPVPVLTGIVIGCLMTILEFPVALRLWKLDRSNFFIFAAAFAAEMLGLAEGVLVGVVLSFASFTMRATAQPSYFLGCMEGHDGFFDLSQTPHARPIEKTILYQFNGPLFFASIEDFERDLSGALKEDTALVVVTGISSVDMFAAERLLHFRRNLKQRGIAVFLAGHAAAVNEQLLNYGAGELVYEGAVRQRLTQALITGGLTPPYPLESDRETHGVRGNAALESFYWAYGSRADFYLDRLARQLAEEVLEGRGLDMEKLNHAEQEVAGEFWNSEDEKEFWSLLEMNLSPGDTGDKKHRKAFRAMLWELMEHRIQLERRLARSGETSLLRQFLRFRLDREAEFLRLHPEAESLLEEQRTLYAGAVRREDPELADFIEQLTGIRAEPSHVSAPIPAP